MNKLCPILILLLLCASFVLAAGAKDYPPPPQANVFFVTDGSTLWIMTNGGGGVVGATPQSMPFDPTPNKYLGDVTFTISSNDPYFKNYPVSQTNMPLMTFAGTGTTSAPTTTTMINNYVKQVTFHLISNGPSTIFLLTPDWKAEFEYPLSGFPAGWQPPANAAGSTATTAPPFDKPPVMISIKPKKTGSGYCVDTVTPVPGSSIIPLLSNSPDPLTGCDHNAFEIDYIINRQPVPFKYLIANVTGAEVKVHSTLTEQDYSFTPTNPQNIAPTLFETLQTTFENVCPILQWIDSPPPLQVPSGFTTRLMPTGFTDIRLVDDGNATDPVVYTVCGKDLHESSPSQPLQLYVCPTADEKLKDYPTQGGSCFLANGITVTPENCGGDSPYLVFADASSQTTFEVPYACQPAPFPFLSLLTPGQAPIAAPAQLSGWATKITQLPANSKCVDGKPCQFQLSITSSGAMPDKLPDYCIAGVAPSTLQGVDENNEPTLRWITKCDTLKNGAILKTITFKNIQEQNTAQFFLYPIKDDYSGKDGIVKYLSNKYSTLLVPVQTTDVPTINKQSLYVSGRGGFLLPIASIVQNSPPSSPPGTLVPFSKGTLIANVKNINKDSTPGCSFDQDVSKALPLLTIEPHTSTRAGKSVTTCVVKYNGEVLFAAEPLSGFQTIGIYQAAPTGGVFLLTADITRAKIYVPQYLGTALDSAHSSTFTQTGLTSAKLIFRFPQSTATTPKEGANEFCVADGYKDFRFMRYLGIGPAIREAVISMPNPGGGLFCSSPLIADMLKSSWSQQAIFVDEGISSLKVSSNFPSSQIITTGITPSASKTFSPSWSTIITLSSTNNNNQYVTEFFTEHPTFIVDGIASNSIGNKFSMTVSSVSQPSSGTTELNYVGVMSVPDKQKWLMTIPLTVGWFQRSFKGVYDLLHISYSESDRIKNLQQNQLSGGVVAAAPLLYGATGEIVAGGTPVAEQAAILYGSAGNIISGAGAEAVNDVVLYNSAGEIISNVGTSGAGFFGGGVAATTGAALFAAASLGNAAWAIQAQMNGANEKLYTQGQAALSQPFTFVIGDTQEVGVTEATASLRNRGVKSYFILPSSRDQNSGVINQGKITGHVLASGKNSLQLSDFSGPNRVDTFLFYLALKDQNSPMVSSTSDCKLFASWYALASQNVQDALSNLSASDPQLYTKLLSFLTSVNSPYVLARQKYEGACDVLANMGVFTANDEDLSPIYMASEKPPMTTDTAYTTTVDQLLSLEDQAGMASRTFYDHLTALQTQQPQGQTLTGLPGSFRINVAGSGGLLTYTGNRNVRFVLYRNKNNIYHLQSDAELDELHVGVQTLWKNNGVDENVCWTLQSDYLQQITCPAN